MSLGWKSTINNAYINPNSLPPALEQTIPSLIKDEIQHLANLSLFQKNVLSSKTSYSQVPVDLKVTENSLNIRLSKEGSWISLLPSSKRALTPEERAVDAVRQGVMKKIALLWGGVPKTSSNESDSEESSFGSSSTGGDQGMHQRARSKKSRRDKKNKKEENHKEPSTIISRNKLDCSAHTANNYYCSAEPAHRLSHTTEREQNVQNPTVDANTQTDFIYPVFRQQNIPTNQSETDSSEDESEHSSTNSFSSKHQMKDSSSDYSDTSELEDSSSEESNHSSSNSFSSKSSKNNSFLKDSDTSSNSSDDQSNHGSTDSLSGTLSVVNRIADFMGGSDSDNESEYSSTSYITVASSNSDISDREDSLSLDSAIPDESEQTYDPFSSTRETLFSHPSYTETLEIFPENPRSEETLHSDIEEDFVIMPSSSELTQEMQYIPPVKAGITSRMQKIWKNIGKINLFNSKTWNVTNSVETTVVQPEFHDYSDKDFQILTPIIKDFTNIEIPATSLSIQQIKKDLSRMKIYVNGFHCLNIRDFITHLGLTLNPEETDIVQSDNPIIPKILYFAHQGFFSSGIREICEKIVTLSDNMLMLSQLDTFATIHIHWNPEFLEQTEIVGEISFQLINLQKNHSLVPNSTHLLKIKNSLYRQEQEITFTKVPQKPNDQLEDDFEIIETARTPKESSEEFTLESLEVDNKAMEASSDDQFENIDIDNEGESESTFKTTLDYLLNKTNSPLRPGITSEYLNTLKNKYPNFVYDDRLMYGNIPVSMDTIIDFLTALKTQYPGNQVIFLPFLVKGWTVDHAVVGVVNLSNETIEYFDPKGQSWLTTRIEKQSNKNVFDFLTEIGKKVLSPTFSKEKIIYNKKNVPQGTLDNINCGVFCLQFIEERLNHSFDAIEDGIVGKLTNPLHIRHQLANKFQETFETEKITNLFTINSLDSPEKEKGNDTLSILLEDTEESIDNQTLNSYEFIPSSDIETTPLLPMSTIPTKSSTPLFLSPRNPFHLGKYSHLLRIIKENFSKFSSDTNLTALKRILNQDNLDSREKYRKYVEELRKLLQDTTLEEETRTNLERLCYAEFTTNVMTNFIEHFLQEATNHTLQSPSELTMHTIADAIIATNNRLKDSPSKKELIALYSQKLAGELGINFDPTKYSNIPEVRSIHTVKSSSKKQPYQIIYMRHGTPTIETGLINPPQDTDNFFSYPLRRLGGTLFKNYQANTIPEYRAFLNRARDLNTPVFYVNHQNMINKTSSEYSRSRAIQNHEITHPDHFFFLTLPLDGRVLNHVQNTDQWKKELIENLMNEKNGFILPTKLKNDFAEDKQVLEDQFKHLLDRLHDLYFTNQLLSHTDQQILLMIFYSYIKDFIKEKCQIQIMVSACKDNKDRGNTSSSIDEALYNLRLGRENDPNALYDLYIRFFAPFLIKYDHIIRHRFKLLISILQHISTLTDTQKQAIRQFQINNFEILDQKVPR